jgi:hypothetical protein
MRTLHDDAGTEWEAVALPVKVAHLRDGARLAFRRSGEAGSEVTSPIDFNSMAAADFAIGTMSEKELRRRLQMAMTAAGVTR